MKSFVVAVTHVCHNTQLLLLLLWSTDAVILRQNSFIFYHHCYIMLQYYYSTICQVTIIITIQICRYPVILMVQVQKSSSLYNEYYNGTGTFRSRIIIIGYTMCFSFYRYGNKIYIKQFYLYECFQSNVGEVFFSV